MNVPAQLAAIDATNASVIHLTPGVTAKLASWRESLCSDLGFIMDVVDKKIEFMSSKDLPEIDRIHDDLIAICQRAAFKARILFENDCQPHCDVVRWAIVAPVFVGGRLAKILGFCGLTSQRDREIGSTEITLVDTYAEWLGNYLLRTVSIDRVYADLPSVRSIVDSTSEAILALDSMERVVFANAVAERLIGERLAAMQGRPVVDVLELIDAGEQISLSDLVGLVVATGSPLTLDAQAISRRTGMSTRVEGRVTPVRQIMSGMIAAIISLRDVEATADLRTQLTWQFSHDQLTGLVNRFEIESKINDVFVVAPNGIVRASLVHFGIDGLGMVNNLCGPSGGDELLKRVAQMLRVQAGRLTENVGRIGGDEFAVLLEDFDLRRAKAFAEGVLKAMDGLFVWNGEEIPVTISAGIVPLRVSSPTADDVLLASAMALSLAKETGRGEIRVLRSTKEGAVNVSDLQTIGMIRRALDQNRIALLSQRIQPLPRARHQTMHHEILVRIRSESGSLISPDKFIPAAERNNLMPLLDKAIVAAALRLVHKFPQDDVLSINLSGKTISYPAIFEYIQEQLEVTGVTPSRICFEITETAAINNESLAVDFVRNLKSLGCMISLDDFGAGHHNFVLMKEMAPEFIKIDGSFVRSMFKEADGFDVTAIRSIVDVAEKINAEVIAESVEDEKTMQALSGMGVSFIQGWHIHRPELIVASS